MSAVLLCCSTFRADANPKGSKPAHSSRHLPHAQLIEDREKDKRNNEKYFLYLAVCQEKNSQPFLIVTQHYEPGPDEGFHPGVLILPETFLLVVGAGTCLLAYQLDQPSKLWEDITDVGFWGWQRYQDVVIMSAELELAVWDHRGKKLWAMFVEPPWNYRLDENTIHVEVMGAQASFPIQDGPPGTIRWS